MTGVQFGQLSQEVERLPFRQRFVRSSLTEPIILRVEKRHKISGEVVGPVSKNVPRKPSAKERKMR